MYKDLGHREHSRLEDEYFYKKDRELIDKIKNKEREKSELLERTTHYHRCAKCGHGMEDRVWSDFSLLVCKQCHSLHLSLETLEKIQQSGKLKMLLSEITETLDTLKTSA